MSRRVLHGHPMTPAERQAKKRTARLLAIEMIRDSLELAYAASSDEKALAHIRDAVALLDDL